MRFVGLKGGGAWVSALAVLMGTVVVAAPQASASADGCVTGWAPQSCVQVQGAGTYVDWARGGVMLAARSSARGHFEVWGEGFTFTTSDETLSNQSYVARTKWGETVTVGRDLPKGSRFCAAFQPRRSDGTYGRMSPACVAIG